MFKEGLSKISKVKKSVVFGLLPAGFLITASCTPEIHSTVNADALEDITPVTTGTQKDIPPTEAQKYGCFSKGYTYQINVSAGAVGERSLIYCTNNQLGTAVDRLVLQNAVCPLDLNELNIIPTEEQKRRISSREGCFPESSDILVVGKPYLVISQNQ